VDLLVNDAGFGLGAMFLDTSLDDWDWIARTDLFESFTVVPCS
jgi:NAD(P)-dependent dehydrogenase (short-subunit alcohol dehydrogenase family)